VLHAVKARLHHRLEWWRRVVINASGHGALSRAGSVALVQFERDVLNSANSPQTTRDRHLHVYTPVSMPSLIGVRSKPPPAKTPSPLWRVKSTPHALKRGKGTPYSISERIVPELTQVLGSQPAGDVSHKPGGKL